MQKLFYIDYPQEHFEGQLHRYRCKYCQRETTKINGLLAGHAEDCQYRIQMEKSGYQCYSLQARAILNTTDEED